MQNVIAFPKKTDQAPVLVTLGAKTMFVHIKRTTLIMHLAAQPVVAAEDTRIGRQN